MDENVDANLSILTHDDIFARMYQHFYTWHAFPSIKIELFKKVEKDSYLIVLTNSIYIHVLRFIGVEF